MLQQIPTFLQQRLICIVEYFLTSFMDILFICSAEREIGTTNSNNVQQVRVEFVGMVSVSYANFVVSASRRS